MTFTVSPWVVIGVLWLALFGAWFLATRARDGARGAAGWLAGWLHGRIDPPWWWKPWLYRRTEDYDDRPEGVLCAGCVGFDHYDGVEGGCDCTCGWPEDWGAAEFDLPPERSREELGFTGPQTVLLAEGAEDSQRFLLQLQRSNMLTAARERRAPWWEAEHRAAYVAMGFEYPSGLMARVREAAP